jgi:hypothetical protein
VVAAVSKVINRSAAQCRERWENELDPSINRGIIWTEDEDRAIAKAQLSHTPKGASWVAIAKGLTTVTPVGVTLHRTANSVRNRWHARGPIGQALRARADPQELKQAEEARAAAKKAAKDARGVK